MTEKTIDHPTYMADIRHFFDDVDLAHMGRVGIDLSTYDHLKARSTDVYFQTVPPNANMPPDPKRKWSPERSQSFKNWIRDGHPFGEPNTGVLQSGTTARVRKDARALSNEEIATLTRAFKGLMKRTTDNPNSYFSLAGLHWYPSPFYCKHHEDRYNPWHRAYLIEFEDALRTVKGCEDVTIPYWDITTTPPGFLFAPPFDKYTLPKTIHANYPKGYITQRYDAQTITSNVASEQISGIIDHAMTQAVWSNFVTYTASGIEAAHDHGHAACGVTLSSSDVAAFDPLFWFFHANWDRLWWEWQQLMRATTLWTFRSTITGSTDFLDGPPFNTLGPFGKSADSVIDLAALDISYTLPESETSSPQRPMNRESFGSRGITRGLRVKAESLASVRLKAINRLAIPGSFRAILFSNGQRIAHRTFFQPTKPAECGNCRKNSHINLDFAVGVDEVHGQDLSVQIELVIPDPKIGTRIPLHAVGDPSFNVRLLLQER